MESLTKLAIPIYQKLGKQYPNLTERLEATKQYILNEITNWTIKGLTQNKNYFFKPNEFNGTEDSTPFEIRLVYIPDYDIYQLKFGNLNATSEDERYKWSKDDPFKLSKALFFQNVITNKIIPLLKSGDIRSIEFMPHDEDELGDDRLSYFRNIFDKLGKNEFKWNGPDNEGRYYISSKKTNV
jgi:hypothetical protein